MQDIFDMIYVEGDLLKSACYMLCLVFIFEFVLTIFSIVKSAYKSVLR